MRSVLLCETSPFSDYFRESWEQNDNVVQPVFDKSNDCRSKEEDFIFFVVLQKNKKLDQEFSSRPVKVFLVRSV